LEAGVLRYLAQARSNHPEIGDGARLYREHIMSRAAPAVRAAAGHAAARALDPGADTELAGYRLSSRGRTVVVEDRRTGGRESVDVAVSRPSVAKIAVVAGGHSGGWNDLPERHRTIIRRALTKATLKKCFARADLESLESGANELTRLAQQGLVEAAGSVGDGSVEEAVARLTDMLDLLGLVGIESIPFDAQTRFYHVWSRAAGDLRARLDALAPRLGFLNP
jgi:hypothetical protein